MSRFQTCLQVVLGHEGGYVNHRADRGGATNFGITQKTLNDFCKATGRIQMNVNDLGKNIEIVEAIYSAYWKDAKCDVLPEPLDLLVFDCAINSGAGRAVKLLQRALGVGEDGVYGNQTAEAIREEVMATSVDHLCYTYLDERAAFFERLVEKDPSQNVFLKGWLNRIDHLREFV